MYRITDIGTYDYIVEEAPKFYKEVDGERTECERWDAEYVETKQWGTRRVWRGTDLNAEDSNGQVVIVQDPGILTSMERAGEQHTAEIAGHTEQILIMETAMCETAAVSEERIDAVEQAICESSEQSEGRMDVIELAVCESAALADERIAAIEQALCELATAMEG